MDKLGKFLQRDLVNASPSRFLMDDVKENEMASSLPQNVTADYVRAIGSDGKSYRIPKADFASIIRSELGTILNGLSDQQTVTKVPTLNGATLGASAVATLASVLGGVVVTLPSSGGDLNNCTERGKYFLNMDFSKISNMPPTGQLVTRSIVVVENRVGIGSSTFISQTLYEMFVSQIWYRTCKDGTWSSWQRIDNYGTSSLSELASALGAPVDKSGVSANTLTDIGRYCGNLSGTPYSNTIEVIMEVSKYLRTGTTNIVQICYPVSASYPPVMRTSNDGGSTWTGWMKFTMAAV